MISKEELLKKLRSDPEYSKVLKSMSSSEQRRDAISVVEHIVGSLYDGLLLVSSTAQQDPEISDKISEALKTGGNIIKESDGSPLASGSKG